MHILYVSTSTCKINILMTLHMILEYCVKDIPYLCPLFSCTKLLHKRALVDLIHGLVWQGIAFHAMETLLAENYCTRYCSKQLALVPPTTSSFDPLAADFASNDLIKKCFQSTFCKEECRIYLCHESSNRY